MKKIITLVLMSAMILNLSACTERKNNPENSLPETESQSTSQSQSEDESEPESSSEETKSLRTEKIPSPPLSEYNDFEVLEVYRYFGDGKIYSHTPIDFKNKERTILNVIDTSASVLEFVKEPLPIKSVEQQESYIIVDFDEEFIHMFSKYELDEIRNTIAMTLTRNNIGDNYLFTLDGDKNILGGNFQPAEFKVSKVNAEECKKLTDTVPYEVFDDGKYDAQNYKETFGTEPDKTETEIYHLLKIVGKIEGSAASPEELDSWRMFYGLVCNTRPYYTDKSYADNEYNSYVPKLMPIADSVSEKTGIREDMFWIADHVKQTAKIIFGDDFELDMKKIQENISPYSYFPDEGIITPPHSGGGYNVLPYVKSYKETDGNVEAEIVYLFDGMMGISTWGSEKEFSPEEIQEYVKTTDNIVKVSMKREKDGRLIFKSCTVTNS